MSGDPTDPLTVANRLTEVLEAGDADGYRDLFTEDAVIWHNHDQVEMTPEASAEMFAGLGQIVPDAAWVDRRVDVTGSGFVVRSTFTGTGPGGSFAAPTCVVATVSPTGRISRLDEYLDPSQLAALVG